MGIVRMAFRMYLGLFGFVVLKLMSVGTCGTRTRHREFNRQRRDIPSQHGPQQPQDFLTPRLSHRSRKRELVKWRGGVLHSEMTLRPGPTCGRARHRESLGHVGDACRVSGRHQLS
jgi:hypothetical protein